MKSIKIIIFLIINTSVFSQLTDTTCLNARWLKISPSKKNDYLFPLDVLNNTFIDLLDLAVKDKIHFYWYNQNSLQQKISPTIFNFEIDSLNSHNFKNISHKENQTLKLKFGYKLLENSQGEDSVFVDTDGTTKLYQPPMIECNFKLYSVNTIKIKEELVYIEERDTMDYVVSSIGYVLGNFIQGYKTFWIDMDELTLAMKTEPVKNWFILLRLRNYYGFQYAQQSCYDKLIDNY